MNNPILTLMRASRISAAEENLKTASSWPTTGTLSGELATRDYPRRTVALRSLCFALVAVIIGMVALVLVHQSSQAQTTTTTQGGGVES